MSVKINTLEIENVKRIKAVQFEPTKNGLTVIGGRNRQGKTSVLDSIAWALGGEKYRPSQPKREGSFAEPHLKLTLDNGIVVERGGKNGSLKVTDSTGKKGGQQLLNSFVEQFALDLPRFMNQSAKDKAATLLRIIGVGDKLGELERTEKELYDRRTAIGRIADQKEKYAKEMPVYAGVPAEPVSAGELIKQQQEILARNGENQRKRDQREDYAQQLELAKSAYEQAKMRFEAAENNFKLANLEAQDLEDESTAELERNIAEIDELNAKIRANLDREHAEIDAEDYRSQYSHLTEQIADARQAKTDLLKGADLPLEGLSVEEGELLYKGCKWDGMSGAEQLVVATSIVRRLNPDCGFVLLDKLEQMDAETLADFGKWLEEQGLQAIATRVSTGGECSIIIEDGTSFVPEPQTKTGFNWNGGKF
ncbi:AAA family ATPase [Ruminococcus sp. 210702-SL.1.03]|uniref:AAA family ATPase n=1 Tax=Ruminococcus sp. 210702-SL.1.03 TaxID=2883233 RepID=UPI001D0905B9|nr:AAA family ATPase [Ruminococcus sp. 210702-SL.1.03]MCB6617092.1 AAA family ATPase [Ruminococcus sp. 210702-SL.1.03]